jgi:hypothetical protein
MSRGAGRLAIGLAGAALAAAARADSLALQAWRDATIYSQPPPVELANGSGQNLFAGRTWENDSFTIRRALLSFDVAGNLPAGAVVTGAALRLSVTRAPDAGLAEVAMALFRSAQDWGEGPSDPPGTEGPGTAAQSGDVTWWHRFYDTVDWTAPGGDHAAAASAAFTLGGLGTYLVESPELLADVQSWLAQPGGNYGWLLVGDEAHDQTARRFSSRNSGDADTEPLLLLEYAVVPEPGSGAFLAAGVVLILRRSRSRVAARRHARQRVADGRARTR